MQTVENLEQVIAEFRKILPAETATAQAIDRCEPWERIALRAVEDATSSSPTSWGTLSRYA